jgi:hypothetical protein
VERRLVVTTPPDRVWQVATVLLGLLASIARAEPGRAAGGAPEGEDVTYEANDSLAAGEVELGLGIEGSASRKPQHRRRVRFDEPDFAGALREGARRPALGWRGGRPRPPTIASCSQAVAEVGTRRAARRAGRALAARGSDASMAGRRGRAGEGLLVSREVGGGWSSWPAASRAAISPDSAREWGGR